MTVVSILGSWGPRLPWGALFFLSLRILVRGRFGGRVLGFGCACCGFGVVPKRVESDAWSWDSGNLGISCKQFLNTV